MQSRWPRPRVCCVPLKDVLAYKTLPDEWASERHDFSQSSTLRMVDPALPRWANFAPGR